MNMLVNLDLRLDIPEGVVETIMQGEVDDNSHGYHARACVAVQSAIDDDPSRYLEYVTEQEVEVGA